MGRVARASRSRDHLRPPRVRQLLLDDELEQRQLDLDDLPGRVQHQAQVCMRGDVAESGNSSPRDLGMAPLNLFRKLSRRIGQGEEAPKNSVLVVNVGEESRMSHASTRFDQCKRIRM
jgi:hypothetical protein